MKKGFKTLVLAGVFAVGFGVFGVSGKAFAEYQPIQYTGNDPQSIEFYKELNQRNEMADKIAYAQSHEYSNFTSYDELAKAEQIVFSYDWKHAMNQWDLDDLCAWEDATLGSAKAFFATKEPAPTTQPTQPSQPSEPTQPSQPSEPTQPVSDFDRQLKERNDVAEKIAYADSHQYSNFSTYEEFAKAVNVVVSFDWKQAFDQWDLDAICNWESKELSGAKTFFDSKNATTTTTTATTTVAPVVTTQTTQTTVAPVVTTQTTVTKPVVVKKAVPTKTVVKKSVAKKSVTKVTKKKAVKPVVAKKR